MANESENRSLSVVAADQSVDMFTERGFQLAQRIGKAFATSDAVPTPFRAQVLKKAKDANGYWVEEVVENPSAMGNCLIAIETARAVRMSITAVMQNANVIENRLTWSGKFVIAAINASGRFTPLRFQKRNFGPIKAKYREKQGYNKQKGGYDFKDIEVDIENLECIAWALPKGVPEPRVSLEQMREFHGEQLDLYKALGLPVIESAPVSMRLAVEEGWYGKAGSKWQTEMKHLMLQYRAGSFFGNIHAPDIVMGMGQTTEEIADTTVIDMDTGEIIGKPDVAPIRRKAAPAAAEVVEEAADTGEVASNAEAKPEVEADQGAAAETKPAAQTADAAAPADPPPVAAAKAKPAATPKPQTIGNTVLASAGEKKLLLNRAKSNELNMAELIEQAGVGPMDPTTLEGLTVDGFQAIKELLPKAA